MSRPDRILHSRRARRLQVARTEELSPTMRRLVLSGDDLEPELPFLRLASADHVKLVFPDETTGDLVLPGPGESGVIKRDYTIRRFDGLARELTIDAVLHPHGPAGRWARDARPGSTVGVLGPRSSRVFPDRHAHYLFVADETGHPAVARFLEELPPAAAVTAVLVGSDTPVPARPHARVVRVPKGGDPFDGLTVPPDTFAWAAGEAGLMSRVRNHLRETVGLAGDQVVVKGYWRQGVAGPLPRE